MSAVKLGISERKAPISIALSAVERIKFLLSKREKPSLGIRIGVKSGGCSGLTYIVEYADEKRAFEEEIKQDGVTIFIDPKAIMYLIGSEMSYIEEKFKSGFVFNNPNEKAKCGCGESFAV
jgi:iron-sulfur cluster assembly protein